MEYKVWEIVYANIYMHNDTYPKNLDKYIEINRK